MRQSLLVLALAAAAAWAYGQAPPPGQEGKAVFDMAMAEGTLAKDLTPGVKLQAGGKPINVDVGHAAPFVADWNGDGTMHLLVGQFGEGKLRIYKNVGAKSEPRFGEFAWFKAGNEVCKVPSG